MNDPGQFTNRARVKESEQALDTPEGFRQRLRTQVSTPPRCAGSSAL